MAVIFIRTILIYMLLLAVMRLSGKRQIGEIQTSELVTTFLLSDIASYPLTDPSIPLLNAVVPIFTIIPLEIIISFLTTKSTKTKNDSKEQKKIYKLLSNLCYSKYGLN